MHRDDEIIILDEFSNVSSIINKLFQFFSAETRKWPSLSSAFTNSFISTNLIWREGKMILSVADKLLYFFSDFNFYSDPPFSSILMLFGSTVP